MEHLSAEDFLLWDANAKPGDSTVYYRGERSLAEACGEKAADANKHLRELRRVVQDAGGFYDCRVIGEQHPRFALDPERRTCALTQRCLADGTTEYVAQKVRR